MANINSADVSYYDGFAEEIMGKFQRLRKLTAHNGASGSYHEEILKVVLRNFLTTRYSVKTGFIFKDDSSVSKQLDIIIVDEFSPAAYIFQEDDFVVVMPEAVIAVIEVKTTLNSTQFDLAIENIRSAKLLFDNPAHHPGLIFGYQSVSDGTGKMNNDKLNTRFNGDKSKLLKGCEQLAPDAIFWLQDNFSTLKFDSATKSIGNGAYYHSFNNPDGNTGWQLSVLLSIVVSACEQIETNRTGRYSHALASRYLKLNTMEISDDGFNWGIEKIAVPEIAALDLEHEG